MVFTLEEMVVVFQVARARWATVIVTETPFMEKGAYRELLPTEFVEKSASAGVFGVNR